MYYDKRIRYLSYYESDIKLQNAGYAKFQVRDSLCQMVVFVKGPRLMGGGEAAVYLLSRKNKETDDDSFYSGGRDSGLEKHLLGNLSIRGGQGHCAVRMNAENMADSGLRYDEICGIRIELHEYQYLESQWNVVNFMPERREVPAGEGERAGYRLRQSQGAAPEKRPVEINLMVTPVSENARVEKIVREEAGAETADSVQEMPEREEQSMKLTRSAGLEKPVQPERVPTGRLSVGQENLPEEKETELTEETMPAGREGLPAEQESLPEEAASAEQDSLITEETLTVEGSGPSAGEALPLEQGSPFAGEALAAEQKGLSTEEEVMSGAEISVQEKSALPAEEEEMSIEERLNDGQELKSDKWEQLRNTYPVVHPIREEEEYLKISPRDFVIFTEKYQQLVHNSFLLHGYHNYKHLILGKKEKDGRVVYYLGVPGTFHDREKTVAVMFGFEAFDGKREPAENGDFGYYLRRVEI